MSESCITLRSASPLGFGLICSLHCAASCASLAFASGTSSTICLMSIIFNLSPSVVRFCWLRPPTDAPS
eukprot:2792782-Pyramimonas_sp.AAC.1